MLDKEYDHKETLFLCKEGHKMYYLGTKHISVNCVILHQCISLKWILITSMILLVYKLTYFITKHVYFRYFSLTKHVSEIKFVWYGA